MGCAFTSVVLAGSLVYKRMRNGLALRGQEIDLMEDDFQEETFDPDDDSYSFTSGVTEEHSQLPH